MSLDLAQRSLERIIANVELNSILQEKEDLQDIHLLCALFVSLDQSVGNIWFKEFLDDVTDKVVNIQQSNLLLRNKSIWKIAPHLNQSKKLLKENVLLKILETINFNKKKNKVIFVIRDTCNTKTFCGELHIYPLKTLLK